MYAEVSGIKLYYEVKGTGRPLVLLHGNGEDHTIFNEAEDVLSSCYTCYLIDSRDHGKSTRVKELHYADMAEDIRQFLEQMDLRDVILYGFSDGGIIGLLLCMKTDRVTDLIISGANLTPNGVIGRTRLEIELLARLSSDEKIQLMKREPQIDPLQLHAVKARTLVLAGQYDAVSRQETELIAASIPGAQWKILPCEGHGTYIVHTRKIADIILGWLNGKRNS